MTEVLGRGARPPDDQLRYGDAAQQVLDVYRPDGTPSGAAVFVHGGFWRNRYDRVHARPLAEDLAARGMLVMLVEYRRVGDDGSDWPEPLADVTKAIDAAADICGEVGLPAPIVIGHSAGGHLAVLAAARTNRARRVVTLAGVLDLGMARSLGLSDGAVDDLLGFGAVAVEEFGRRLIDADPILSGAPRVETVLVHGLLDNEVPIALSRAYAAAHPSSMLVEVPGAGHYELIDPEAPAFTLVCDVIGVPRRPTILGLAPDERDSAPSPGRPSVSSIRADRSDDVPPR